MARTFITEYYPTLSAVAMDLRRGTPIKDCTRADVVQAVKARGVPVLEGRIHRRDIANVYFGVARERGLLETPAA